MNHVESMMNAWRGAFVLGVVVCVFVPAHDLKSRAMAGSVVLVPVVLVYFHLYRAAVLGGPSGYAKKQLTRALLLTPVFLFGFLVVPWRVRSDVNKWAAADSRTDLTDESNA